MRAGSMKQGLVLCLWSQVIAALLTLGTIRELTESTLECRDRILESGKVDSLDGSLLGRDSGQVVVGIGGHGGGEDRDEVEEAVAAALRLLCSDILNELEKPLASITDESNQQRDCPRVIEEYHTFLAATVKFLFAVQQRQEKWRWSGDSGVFNGVSWMQGLWASRGANNQNRSFIEQQMSLYGATGCFGKSKEVLRRDVEVVEYLNDLMDSFQ